MSDKDPKRGQVVKKDSGSEKEPTSGKTGEVIVTGHQPNTPPVDWWNVVRPGASAIRRRPAPPRAG